MGDEEDYEDEDFEDYEDEFEEDEPSGRRSEATIADTLAAENDRVKDILKKAGRGPSADHLQSMRAPPPQPKVTVSAVPARPHFIAPVSQAERQAGDMRKKRLEALRPILGWGARAPEMQLRTSMETVLFDQAPVSQYDLCARQMSWKLRCKPSQTGEDNLEATTQTEEIESNEQVCQWPEDKGTGNASSLTASEGARSASVLSANVARLARFLRSSSAVIETLCAENASEAAYGVGGFEPTSPLPFSSRVAKLRLDPALGTRPSVDVCFTDDATSCLTAYGLPQQPPPTKKKDDGMRRAAAGGLLAVWQLYQPAAPSHYLRCVGTPTCCMFCGPKKYLVAAGTAQGAVQLWDTREAASSHDSISLGEESVSLRAPTYVSDSMAGTDAVGGLSHNSPIIALSLVTAASSSEDTTDLSVASLDVSGHLVVWLILETQTYEADSTDYGQTVGGRVRLFKSGTVNLDSANPRDDPPSLLPMRTSCLQFVPGDPSRFLVGSDGGGVLHGSRYNASPQPEVFLAPNAPIEGISAVTCISFCKANSAYLLAGRADGSISLYHVEDATPLFTWSGFSPAAISQIQWAPTRPAVFWALDDQPCLHAFDLGGRLHEPAVSAPLVSTGRAAAAAAGGSAALTTARFAVGARVKVRSQTPTCMLGVTGSADPGERMSSVEVHLLNERLGTAQPDELQALNDLLNSL